VLRATQSGVEFLVYQAISSSNPALGYSDIHLWHAIFNAVRVVFIDIGSHDDVHR
jgi:hypothetical protein